MSDPRTKAERSLAKDIRQGVIDQRAGLGARAKKKKYAIRGVWSMWGDRPVVVGRYASLKDAQKALEVASKKGYYSNLRIEEE